MFEKEITSTVQITEKELAKYFAHEMKPTEFVDFLIELAYDNNIETFVEMMKHIPVGCFSPSSIKLLETMAQLAKENDLKWRRLGK